MSGKVDLHRVEFVVDIVFNNPQRHNAMSLNMWEQLSSHMEDLSVDAGVRVVVFSGAGDKAFVSGSDISEFHEQRSGIEAVEIYNQIASAAEKSVYNCPVPTIGRIKGYCMGGGLGIAMGCDVRICSDDASFSLPAGRLGLGYPFDAVGKLFDVLGPAATSRLFYSGKRFNAQEALDLGLVSQVVANEELDTVVDELALTISRQAPLTLKTYKAALLEYRKPAVERNVDAIDRMVLECYNSDDYAEGQAAFKGKRQPDFKGL